MGIEYVIKGEVNLEYIMNANILVKSGFYPLNDDVQFEPFTIYNTNYFEFVAQIMNLRKLKVDENYALVYFLHDDTMKNHVEIRKMNEGVDYTITSLVIENFLQNSGSTRVTVDVINSDTNEVVRLIDDFCSKIDANIYTNDIQDIINKNNKYHMMRLKWVLLNKTDTDKVTCNDSIPYQQSGGSYHRISVPENTIAAAKGGNRRFRKQDNEIHITMYLHKLMKVIVFRYMIHNNVNIGLREFLGEICVNIIVFLALNDEDYVVPFAMDQLITSVMLLVYKYLVNEKKVELDTNHVSTIILLPYYVITL